ncbi:MAG: VOC family protein [Methylobacter sp.]|nr:VOC family protein [Methylobacter sp.]MDP2100302.1 VOC family protein [Methylobacter sp.]MDP2427104.1 VOC family protein [Methylobacter sp.]MDP3053659.1 VOC family protein [Methylobacter sp.]MDP3360906.1 VOC family protein [Methylobacter sp.]
MPTFNYTLHHASLIVTDTETSVAFYRDILGMQQTERPDLGFPGAWFQLGAQQIHLLELNNPDPTTGRPEHGGRDRHVALTVQELVPIREVLDEKGVTYSMSKSGRKALFCRDPDGNAIEILQQG